MPKIKAKQISDINTTITSVINTTSINALSDVDTATVAPTANQLLSWNGTNWVPATASAASMVRPTIVSTTSNAYVPPAISSGLLEVCYILSPTATATVTLTNITATNNAGLKLVFKKMTSFYVQIIPAGSESIDGFTAGTDMIQQYSSLTLLSNGSSWVII